MNIFVVTEWHDEGYDHHTTRVVAAFFDEARAAEFCQEALRESKSRAYQYDYTETTLQ